MPKSLAHASTSDSQDHPPTPGAPAPLKVDGSALITSLTRVLAEWTSPDFLTAVAAREGVDLDPGAITMVTILARGGAQRPSRLAENMVTGASNISKILARLTAAGLARRIPDPSDARAQLAELTGPGHQVARAFVRAGNGLTDELLAEWSDTDRNDFTRLLAQFEKSTIAFAAHLSSTR
ncbi:MarR family winged helix-turn-helix transcriptional regulator [Arthrobacter cryoconiti]|uniref:MarR family winged helix-turn-helix transcriptional regulator n=1 Tax=Arthrobacter cryoconiti TaxID=748907 RepID=A0ABV8QXB7_9MICC|nr:MarR family transcriptional regulator [Arthrobacter cryoconiti]MCC9067545.1 MarR family transcriptional regulator [Arthrobacter cryoconiti]